MNQQLKDSLQNLHKANSSLHLAVQAVPRNNLVVSAIVKNFEFNYELSCKAMRRLLAHHGVATSTPRQAISESFRKGFIDAESVWIAMIEDRNLTVHTHDETFATEMAELRALCEENPLTLLAFDIVDIDAANSAFSESYSLRGKRHFFAARNTLQKY